jgi:hypothetical protein
MPRKKTQKISFDAIEITVSLSKPELEYLEAYCKSVYRTSDDVLRELIRKLKVPGVASFDKWLEEKVQSPMKGSSDSVSKTDNQPTSKSILQKRFGDLLEQYTVPQQHEVGKSYLCEGDKVVRLGSLQQIKGRKGTVVFPSEESNEPADLPLSRLRGPVEDSKVESLLEELSSR